jgi:basic amino acid/polyamine antiporter, APA family
MPQQPQLIRGLNLRDTTALVVGTIIGTGVFLKTAKMAQAVGSPELVLLAWAAAGLLSLAGALSYAELGAMLPRAGGEYVFLRAAYGDFPAFLFGWMRLVIGSSGSIAIFGVAFAKFLSALVPLDTVWAEKSFPFLGQTIEWQLGVKQLVAVAAILFFSAVNCLRVTFSGAIQTVLTLGKVFGICIIIVGVFFFAPTANFENFRAPVDAKTFHGLAEFFSAFGAAMLAALWAYDGWNNMPMAAGEVKNPERNIPRALIFGMGVVLAVYGLVNLAYCYALPIQEIASSGSNLSQSTLTVAGKAAKSFLPHWGAQLVSIAAILSTIGVLNGSILTGARIPFAMARDGLFFSGFGNLSKNSAVPVRSILFQAIWASVLALSATFDQLTDGVVFAGMIFYAITTAAVFVLRKKMPDAPRPYKTLGYPVVPLVFIIVATILLINTVYTSLLQSLAGLTLIAVGLPVYFWLKKRSPRTTPEPT